MRMEMGFVGREDENDNIEWWQNMGMNCARGGGNWNREWSRDLFVCLGLLSALIRAL
jgi:hypothetical protein